MPMTLTSPAFDNEGEIPTIYTCDGEDISPPLVWQDVPEGAKSLMLIVDDPDAPDPSAPQRPWVHWILYNLPPDVNRLPQNAQNTELPIGAREGVNSWGQTGYGGPCPTTGGHRYFFKLYALDAMLSDLGQVEKHDLVAAMQGHVWAEAVLTGTCRRRVPLAEPH